MNDCYDSLNSLAVFVHSTHYKLMFLCNYSVCFTNTQTLIKEAGMFSKKQSGMSAIIQIFAIKTENSHWLFWVHKQASPIKILLRKHNVKIHLLLKDRCNLLMSVFGLAHGFWIGDSHCALIAAPNTDSQKAINYSSRLDWQFPIIGWLLSFSQVPRSNRCRPNRWQQRKQALPVHKSG